MSPTPLDIRLNALIETLRSDRSVWARAPCGHEYRLAESVLFHGNTIPPSAAGAVEARRAELDQMKSELEQLRVSLTTGFVARSTAVRLGKTMEKIVPGLPGFPYAPLDCRPLFEPIDYIAFRGLSMGALHGIDFIDVKTGKSQLTKIQKSIRDAVEDGKVAINRL